MFQIIERKYVLRNDVCILHKIIASYLPRQYSFNAIIKNIMNFGVLLKYSYLNKV